MSIYGLGSILSKAVQFLLLPLYTRLLTPGDYGTLELVAMFAGLAGNVFGLRIASGYVREHYECTDEAERESYFASAFWFGLAMSTALTGAMLWWNGEAAGLLFHFDEGPYFLALITGQLFFETQSSLFYHRLMVEQKSKSYAGLRLGALVFNLTITVVLMVVFKMGVAGILWANMLRAAAECLLLPLLMKPRGLLRYSPARLKQMLQYALPLVPLGAASFVLNLSDRYFLQYYDTLTSVGLYSLSYRFASMIYLVTNQPLIAFTPHILSIVDNEEQRKREIVRFTTWFVFAGGLLTFALAAVSREIVMVMASNAFADGWKAVFVLGLSYVLMGVANIICIGFDIQRRYWIKTWSWFGAAAINIGLNFLLIPTWGFIGAAVATALSYLAVVVLYAVVLSKIYPLQLAWTRMGIFLALLIADYQLVALIDWPLLPAVAVKTAVVLGSALLFWKSGLLPADERQRVIETVRARLPGWVSRG